MSVPPLKDSVPAIKYHKRRVWSGTEYDIVRVCFVAEGDSSAAPFTDSASSAIPLVLRAARHWRWLWPEKLYRDSVGMWPAFIYFATTRRNTTPGCLPGLCVLFVFLLLVVGLLLFPVLLVRL